MESNKFGKYEFLSGTLEYNIATLEVIQQFETKQKLLPTKHQEPIVCIPM